MASGDEGGVRRISLQDLPQLQTNGGLEVLLSWPGMRASADKAKEFLKEVANAEAEKTRCLTLHLTALKRKETPKAGARTAKRAQPK